MKVKGKLLLYKDGYVYQRYRWFFGYDYRINNPMSSKLEYVKRDSHRFKECIGRNKHVLANLIAEQTPTLI